MRCWYLSYGSNLSEARFLSYILGGSPPGNSAVKHEGARDKCAPSARQHHILKGWQLVFKHSSTWWNGLVCGIQHNEGSSVHSIVYNLTLEQFCDVAKQENGIAVEESLTIDWAKLQREGSLLLFDSMYGLLLNLGQLDGLPILSFTHPLEANHRHRGMHKSVSEPYLRTIIGGLAPHVAAHDLRDYLITKEGIATHWDGEGLLALIQGAANMNEKKVKERRRNSLFE